MARFSKLFLFISLGALMALAGCSDKTSKKDDVEAIKQEKTETEQVRGGEGQDEKENPAIVEVSDPNTKEVIKVFQPEEMGFGRDTDLYKKQLEEWAKELARGSEDKKGYDQRMELDRIDHNGNIIKGKPQIILDEEELVEKIMEASETGGTVELPLYVTHSRYDPDEIETLDEVVVASYTTYYNNGVIGRSKNIELSAAAINNVILGIGDHFSFNTTVGPSDKAHGYQPAEEAVNGKLVMGIGGGICQTSSTLFNAVDQLGVEYVERHHHSVNVGYVPKGRDATVSYGGVDFRFNNTTGVPLLVKAYATKGKLTVELRTSKENKGKLQKNTTSV